MLGLPQLRDALAQIDTGAHSPLSPRQQLAGVRGRLDDAVRDALAGVGGAAEDAAALATQALQIAREVYASGPGAQAAAAEIREQLQALIEAQERREGTLGEDMVDAIRVSTDEQVAAIREQTRELLRALEAVRRSGKAEP